MQAAERAQWLQDRRRFLGASEVAAVVGCDPHRGPLDVWAAKVLPPVAERETPAQQAGRVMEPAALKLYALRTGRSVRPGHHVMGPEDWIACTPDGLAPEPVQVKMVGRWMAGDWGPDGDPDGVPAYYLPQGQWEALCTGAPFVDFIAGFSMTDFRIYRAQRNDELIRVLLDYCRDWWMTYVVPMDPAIRPDGNDAAVIRRAIEAMYPRNVRQCCAPSVDELTLIHGYGSARADLKAATKKKEIAGLALCNAIGDRDGFEGDFGIATWKANRNGKRSLHVRLQGEEDDER